MTWAASAALLAVLAVTPSAESSQTGSPGGGLLLSGTVVTMDARHDVLASGHVLVRRSRIAAVWAGQPPSGLNLQGVRRLATGPGTLIFPGLIDLHAHPAFSVLPLWPAPSSHRQRQFGRPTGREPYDYRYEWSGPNGASEQKRLVPNPRAALTDKADLNLGAQVTVYAEAEAALGGETALQGEDRTSGNGLIVRDIDGENFGRDRIDACIRCTTDPSKWWDDKYGSWSALASAMGNRKVEAWIVHLAEGVRDGDREHEDRFSSRKELAQIFHKHVLTSATVVVHGTALEKRDFQVMRRAGAKLVWSPLSNLLLYGHTTNVYDAIAAGVPVSLGTDWGPSGSKNLLDELKMADIALRSRLVLGASRSQVPRLADELALDRTLVDMATRNPAQALRWPEVGSIARGKYADLLVLGTPSDTPTGGLPGSPYRSLIDATQRDVRLVLVDGKPVAGDQRVVVAAGAHSIAIVHSPAGNFTKAVAYRRPAPLSLRLPIVKKRLTLAMRALGGDRAQPASGPPPLGRGFAYLKARWNNGKDKGNNMSSGAFRDMLAGLFPLGHGRVNLERIELTQLFTADDHFFFTIVEGRRTQSGLPADNRPPFKLYPANVNQARVGRNPLVAFGRRWYSTQQ